MKYADHISGIINAFSLEPLKINQMREFYCGDTMEYRTSDKYSSPMEDILDICREPEEKHAVLLLGHKGCGKSTELNRMTQKLTEDGYYVKTIMCSMDLDLFNIVYTDLFILMGEALLKIAEEAGCHISGHILESIRSFWREGTVTTMSAETGETALETGMSAQTPGILNGIYRIFANMKAEMKFNEETRTEYREKIRVRSSEWIRLLSLLSEEIAAAAQGKRPILIFEDLDKLDPESAWKVFYDYARMLSSVPFPVIYTFPIGLSYDVRFSAMEIYFTAKMLPMIKIQTIENEPFADGIHVIREIVKKRASLELFAPDVLDMLIAYTGGSLRDLFQAIHAAAKRAQRRDDGKIVKEDGERALEELKTTLTRRIEKKNYEFLLNIYNGNKELIEDKKMLLQMLQASVVLEYNGKRWHNLHPLVAKFFREQGMIADDGE